MHSRLKQLAYDLKQTECGKLRAIYAKIRSAAPNRAHNALAILAFAALLWPTIAKADKPPELQELPEAVTKVGQSSFGFLFWDVFDASLWSQNGAFDWNGPFALSLTYRRTFTADALTEKTVEEMARISGEPEAAFADFGKLFRVCVSDVGPGDRITAVSVDPAKTHLFLNGQARCMLDRPGLRRDFFSIWLSKDSLFPDASAKLIGNRAQ